MTLTHFTAPKPLPILNPSKVVPKNGVSGCKGVKELSIPRLKKKLVWSETEKGNPVTKPMAFYNRYTQKKQTAKNKNGIPTNLVS